LSENISLNISIIILCFNHFNKIIQEQTLNEGKESCLSSVSNRPFINRDKIPGIMWMSAYHKF